MAIKVVHRGTPPSEIVYSTTCIGCKSVLEFNESDAPMKGEQRDGYAHVLQCPVCNIENWISTLKRKCDLRNIDPY